MSSLVSVIIPAYNVENYIENCIESILRQTYQDFEILIYDDGSTDSTYSKIYCKAVKNKKIRFWHCKRNQGVSYARNFLFDRAKGDYIMLQDADDISTSDRIERSLKFLNEHDLIFMSSAIQVNNNDNKIYTYTSNPYKILLIQYLCKKPLGGASSLFSREVLDIPIRYDTELVAGEDVLFEAEIQWKFPLQMKATENVYYLYTKRNGSLTDRRKKEVLVHSNLMKKRNNFIRTMLEGHVIRNKKEINNFIKQSNFLITDEKLKELLG